MRNIEWEDIPCINFTIALGFKDAIEGPLRSLWVIAGALIAMSLVMLLAERYGNKSRTERAVTVKDGAVVGLIFDGNIQSLGGSYAYTDVQARAVAVHSEAIIEALRHVYNDEALAAELISGRAQ